MDKSDEAHFKGTSSIPDFFLKDFGGNIRAILESEMDSNRALSIMGPSANLSKLVHLSVRLHMCPGGIPWYQTGEPADGYECLIKYESGKSEEIGPVNETMRVGALLVWLYNYFVHLVPGSTVAFQDEILFEIKNAKLIQSPEWSMTVECFCFAEQEHAVIAFKLHRRQC